MKKKILLMMACGVLAVAMLAGCASSQQNEDPKQSDIELQNGNAHYLENVLTISLNENPTTGYTWSYTLEGTNLVFSNDSYEPDEAEEGVAGSGGTHDFVFEGTSEGSATLSFTEGQPWEGGETGSSMNLLVKTDAQNNIVSVEEIKRPS